jgi:hypothetical protein
MQLVSPQTVSLTINYFFFLSKCSIENWSSTTSNLTMFMCDINYYVIMTFQSICGGFVVLAVGLTTLIQATNGILDSSSVGLALSYVLMVSFLLPLGSICV